MKAQTSLEIIMILALMLTVFLAIIVSNSGVMSTLSARLNEDKARVALDQMADAATSVYEQGSGAKTRVYVSLPSSVFNSSVANETLVLSVYTSGDNAQDVYRLLGINVSGTIPNASGNYWVNAESFEHYVNMSY